MSSDLIKQVIKYSVPGQAAQAFVPAVVARAAHTVQEVLYLDPQPDIRKWQQQSMDSELIYYFEMQSTDPLTGRAIKETQRITRMTYTGGPFPTALFRTPYQFSGVTTTPELQVLRELAAKANNPNWQLVNMPDYILFFRERMQVAVHYPAIAARAAVPASAARASQIMTDERLGWNSGARSIVGLNPSRNVNVNARGESHFSFSVEPLSVGVAVGLVQHDQSTVIHDYVVGVLCAAGRWSAIFFGKVAGGSLGTFRASDVFSLRPLSDGERGWTAIELNGVERIRFESGYVQGPLYLNAALYKGQDAVRNARFFSGGVQALESGKEFGLMRAMTGFGGISGLGKGRGRLPAWHSRGGIDSGQSRGQIASLGGWSVMGAGPEFGVGRAKLAAVIGQAGGTYGIGPDLLYGLQPNGNLVGLKGSARLLSGYTGRHSHGVLPGFVNEASGGLDGARKASRQRDGRLPAVQAIAEAGDPTFARLGSNAQAGGAMQGNVLYVAVIASSGRVLSLYETRSVDGVLLASVAWAHSNMANDMALMVYLDAIAHAKSLLGSEPGLDANDVNVWVMNDRNGAMSQYMNYGFNSFARIGGKYFGADSSGLYLLEGGCDQTEQVAAPIVGRAATGMLDLGSKEIKHVSGVYLSVASEGPIAIDVEVRAGDKNVERHRYYARSQGRNAQQQRVDVGKGLRSNFYSFEASNPDGAMFELEGFDVATHKSGRRT